jgi:arylsulfatase
MKTKLHLTITALSFMLGMAFALPANAQDKPAADAKLDRTVLPIHEPATKPITALDARDAMAPPRFEVKAPQGAPNVVIVLIDDIGFGSSSAFGGPINMPTLEKLAASGLKYNRFHTTALCSPTRTALLTGQNHHANNAGAVMEMATAFPGNTGIRPKSVTTLAEILRQNGYSTGAFGKYHETPPWEVSVSGPMERWPTGSGFDKFYGFIGGETNQWAPAIYDGTVRVEHKQTPDYHFTVDMTDQAINWVSAQHALTPDKPFYMYFATGATHAPKEWIEKYKGKFSGGWDKLREETLERQKKLGVVPADTKLTPRPKEIPAWDDMSADQKRLFERQMETFAGFAEHTDHEVGRLVAQLEAMGVLDNTLFFYIVGDNGASAEGGPEGAYNELMALNGIIGKADQMMDHIDEWGGPNTFPHFAIGWALRPTRLSSGPSRWPATSAERATAW